MTNDDPYNHCSELQALIKHYKMACTHLDLPASAERGIQVIIEIFNLAKPKLKNADFLTKHFASHGPGHVANLARIFEEEIAPNIEKKGDSSWIDEEFLVLLFSAFVLHDVGMGILAEENKNLLLGDIVSEHLNRKAHDERSLEFIEIYLSDKCFKATVPNKELIQWKAFWRKPIDARKALMLLARICQSHGDPLDEFMQEKSLLFYKKRKDGPWFGSSDSNKKYSFKELYPDNWKIIKTKILAASSILCLCDLCDLGSHRFEENDEETQPKIVPKSRHEKRGTFLHWVGHKLCSVKYNKEEKKYELKIVKSFEPRRTWSTLCIKAGPGFDFLTWGNNERLIRTLNEVVRFPFKGTSYLIVGPDSDIWEEIESELEKPEFKNMWPCLQHDDAGHHAINLKLVSPSFFSLVSKKTDKIIYDEQERDRLFSFFNLAYNGLQFDILIQDLLAIEINEAEKNHFHCICSYDLHGKFNIPDSIVFSFATGVNFLKNWIDRDILDGDLIISNSLDGVFGDLLNGQFGNHAHDVIIIPSGRHITKKRCFELYASHSKQDPASRPTILFINSEEITCELIKLGAEERKYKTTSIDINKLLEFCEPLVRHYDNYNEEFYHSICNPPESYSTISSVLIQSYLYITGIEALVSSLDSFYLMKEMNGLILILAIYEFFPILKRENISVDELSNFYSEISRSLPDDLVEKEFSTAFSFTNNNKKINIKLNDHINEGASINPSELLYNICNNNRDAIWISSIVLMYIKYNGKLCNMNSRLFEDNIISLTPSIDIIKYIFDKDISVNKRMSVAFSFANIICYSNGKNFNNILLLSEYLVKHRSLHDGSIFNRLLAFQLSYSVFQAIKFDEEAVTKIYHLFSKYSYLRLGFLEGFANYNYQVTNPELFEACIKLFVNYAKRSPYSIASMMSFDILWKYMHKDGFDADFRDKIIRLYASLKHFSFWESICNYIHLGEKINKTEENKKIRCDWAVMRTDFHFLINNKPSKAMDRREILETLEGRVKELADDCI